jgi:hypothetical protein
MLQLNAHILFLKIVQKQVELSQILFFLQKWLILKALTDDYALLGLPKIKTVVQNREA